MSARAQTGSGGPHVARLHGQGRIVLSEMHIGVDATCWHNRRGYGRHARALLRSLVSLDRGSRYTFFVDSEESLERFPEESEVRLLPTSVPTAVAASAAGRRSLYDLWRVSRALSDPRFDLLLFPTIYSYTPVFTAARKLVMIHDVIAETYPRLTLPRTAARMFWKTKTAVGRMQADAIVTVSEYSRRRILERFRLAPGRVFTVGEASDPAFRVLDNPRPSRLLGSLGSLGIHPGARIVSYLGGFNPHKNLESLVAAFAALSGEPRFSDVVLVMAGDYKDEVFHSYFGAISSQVERLGMGGRVVFTGYLPDEELVLLLNLSQMLVLPSLMEGFGLPAIEAAACGCPVVASLESPLPELLGEGGIFVDPTPAALGGAIARILDQPEVRRQMGRVASAAAARLTWDAAAGQMLDVMRKVMLQ
jgi:glycosyltransferase involved in cell wall biosynthesis